MPNELQEELLFELNRVWLDRETELLSKAKKEYEESLSKV